MVFLTLLFSLANFHYIIKPLCGKKSRATHMFFGEFQRLSSSNTNVAEGFMRDRKQHYAIAVPKNDKTVFWRI